MKQCTSTEQTNKLIELGMPSPKYILDAWAHETDIDVEYEYECAYSIGELIEILDNIPNNMWDFMRTSTRVIKVEVIVFPSTKKDEYLYKISYNKELIDALYDMIIMLKEEGII
jgi:hypothetical protein